MFKMLTVTLLLASNAACATLFSGTTQPLSIQSEPPGAAVFIDQQYRGDTPLLIEVDRSLGNKALTLKKAGHPDLNTALVSRFNPVTLINLIEPIGWVVDALTGAFMKFDQHVHLTLPAASAPGAAPMAAPTVPPPYGPAPLATRR